jgi:hypothetical protein
MNYKFNEGDGVTHLTATVKEREEITKLLKKHNYPSHANYENNSSKYGAYGGSWANQFTNNFRFNKQGKWVTSSKQQVTNPMTFEEMKNKILNLDPQYEIY